MGKIIGYVSRHHWGMLAVFIALGGTAVAATGSTHSTVHACASKKTGALRLRGRGCRHNERLLVWSKRGPAGQTGPTGPSDGYYAVSEPGTGFDPASVKVPPGNYVAYGGCTASQSEPYPPSSEPKFGSVQAFLTTGLVLTTVPYAPGTVESDASVPNLGANVGAGSSEYESGAAALSNSSGFSLPSGGTITEECRQYVGPHGNGSSDNPVKISNTYVTAIRVGSLQQEQGVPPAGG